MLHLPLLSAESIPISYQSRKSKLFRPLAPYERSQSNKWPFDARSTFTFRFRSLMNFHACPRSDLMHDNTKPHSKRFEALPSWLRRASLPTWRATQIAAQSADICIANEFVHLTADHLRSMGPPKRPAPTNGAEAGRVKLRERKERTEHHTLEMSNFIFHGNQSSDWRERR